MNDMDNFKQSFKYFKGKTEVTDLPGVIDFELHNASELVVPLKNFMKTKDTNCMLCVELGLIPHHQWSLYSLEGSNGFIYIKNPFTCKGQQYWIQNCLHLYPRKPAITNLDLHHKCIDDIWSLQGDIDPLKRTLIDKLSWVTLGYHYNWDAKVYNPDRHSDFPKCLADLAKHVASCLNFKTFIPEAAILNYYKSKSSLGIHNDHSEDDHEEPIISFSFGQTAIFLLGTRFKTEKPVPIFLRSGDIIILSGACRLSYHAVPLIIDELVCSRYCESDDDGWKPFHQYIKKHRINISVRKVYQSSAVVPK